MGKKHAPPPDSAPLAPRKRERDSRAILARAVAQGCRLVWDGDRLVDVVGPRLAMMEFAEAVRRLVGATDAD